MTEERWSMEFDYFAMPEDGRHIAGDEIWSGDMVCFGSDGKAYPLNPTPGRKSVDVKGEIINNEENPMTETDLLVAEAIIARCPDYRVYHSLTSDRFLEVTPLNAAHLNKEDMEYLHQALGQLKGIAQMLLDDNKRLRAIIENKEMPERINMEFSGLVMPDTDGILPAGDHRVGTALENGQINVDVSENKESSDANE